MNRPRIDVDLIKIRHNTRAIVDRLKIRGIHVTAVTKATCGHPAIARAMLDGGATGLAEARLSNVKRLRQNGMTCPITLIRTPMRSQVDDVVKNCDASYNTQITVIEALAAAAIRQNKEHGVILMVEMGDLREGIMPQHLGHIGQQVVDMAGVALKGIGANFACLGGSAPTTADMKTLTRLANDVEGQCGPCLQTVSGGNSASLPWAFGARTTGRINDLRLGEAILLGRDPITGDPIKGLLQDTCTLVAEVIEMGTKPAQRSAGCPDTSLTRLRLVPETSESMRIILAVGYQDTDAAGLSMPAGVTFFGATSDHLVIGTQDSTLCVGSEIRLQMNYSALMRGMAAPDIRINICNDRPWLNPRDTQAPGTYLALV